MFRKVSVAVGLAGLLVAAPAFAQQPAAIAPASKKPVPAARQQATPKPAVAVARTTKPKAAPRHRFTKADVRAAQEGLAKAGFYKGKATGVWNGATTRALRAWQKANKEKATGRLTREELVKLKPQPQG